ncbi:MAG: hypothetical protein CL847_06225 [Crocinitomicaceae bacterium]|nr:hypothetical protein [Crocinitomicaceae bacterium]|tara:strand:+ start:577 stop:2706 length:2130 start_codon:yes stop_codon:yes gene_type:complete
MKKVIGILLAFATFSFSAFSQEINISTVSDYSSCEGAVVDSGQSAADYGANENHSITWCPEAPETILNFYWVVFDLDAASTLTIYDGDSNAAPLIGTFTGTELQGQDITSTNVTGCLTIEFVSGPNSVGNFGAYASCGEPCERPFAIVIPDNQPLQACIGEDVYLSAAESTVAVGQDIISWEWNFGDGTMGEGTDPTITHTYSQPGLYVIDLDITDSNECSNLNVIDYQVLVSTNPDFTGTSGDLTMCVGEEEVITGQVQGVLYTADPSVDFGDGLYIPDDQTQCFYSQLTFTNFYPGAVVNDANNDIVNAFINFEHSYMGDLTITFICPNGQSLLVHQQGGAGTYLGVPIDNDAGENPGVGWDYYWAPDATNGTWEANAGGTLPAGTYESVQPFSNLNGCPLNGTWEIEVCDLWSIDNGFIFDWSIEFAPELYPEAVSFTPTFGDDCDSTFWAGPSVIDLGDDCSDVVISPQIPGVETYTFYGINDFGCQYTQSMEVTAVGVAPLVTANPPQFCGTSVQLNADLNNDEINLDDCTFNWDYSGSTGAVLEGVNTLDPVLTQMDYPTEFTFTLDYNVPNVPGLVCSNSFSVLVETCEITIPNVFTPNDDAINDRWIVEGLSSYPGSKVIVYDRWGVEMCNIEVDPNSESDPTWDPDPQVSEGVYFYVIEIYYGTNDLIVIDQFDNEEGSDILGEGYESYTGSFHLLRDPN